MGQTLCPHCAAPAAYNGLFCPSCGKAVPAAVPTGPRVISAAGAGGAGPVDPKLLKQIRTATYCFLAIAIIQTLLAMVAPSLAKANFEHDHPGQTMVADSGAVLLLFGIAALFWGLYFWARKNPLPAAIVGLVLYVTLVALSTIFDPRELSTGWIIKALFVAALVQAIVAGVKIRKLEQGARG